jgi:hypothetical protein
MIATPSPPRPLLFKIEMVSGRIIDAGQSVPQSAIEQRYHCRHCARSPFPAALERNSRQRVARLPNCAALPTAGSTTTIAAQESGTWGTKAKPLVTHHQRLCLFEPPSLTRRFPPPWSVEEKSACFVVRGRRSDMPQFQSLNFTAQYQN